MNLIRHFVFLYLLIIGGGSLVSSVWATDVGQPGGAPQTPGAASMITGKDAACVKCHNNVNIILPIYQTKHGVKGDSRTPSCQSCHGESTNHMQERDERLPPDVVFGTKKGTFSPSEAKAQNTSCLACHDKDSQRTNWTGSAHQTNNLSCASCHSIHSANDKVRNRQTSTEVCFTCHKEQRTDSNKMSHHPVAEGKVTCFDCHNPHGSTSNKLLKKNTVNETCFTCHAEKRGPFLWEHQPVAENCSNCHIPHGSNIKPLLKSRPPFMCQECHNGPHVSKSPAAGNAAGNQGGLTGDASTLYTGRACMNCHTMVHGSNSPAGAVLHR